MTAKIGQAIVEKSLILQRCRLTHDEKDALDALVEAVRSGGSGSDLLEGGIKARLDEPSELACYIRALCEGKQCNV